jgi:hypothetical protein
MVKTILNTLQIVWVGAGVLARDRLMLLFALMSSIAFTGAIVLMLVVLNAGKAFERVGDGRVGLFDALFIFGSYVLVCFAGIYFQVALIAAARDRLEKAFTSLEVTLDTVNNRLGAVFAWAAFAGTIGFLIKRMGRGTKAQAGDRSLFGRGWDGSLVLPVMIVEAETPVSAMGRTEELFTQVWGAGSVANFGFFIVYAYLAVLLAWLGVGVHYLTDSVAVAAGLSVSLFLLLTPIIRSIESLLAIDLYYYAAAGGAGFFPEGLLRRAYVPRDQRGRWQKSHVETYAPVPMPTDAERAPAQGRGFF